MSSPSRQSGFSLIEIAVVLTIIALLVGGVLTAQSMVQQSYMTKLMHDIGHIQESTVLYRERYNSLPGDTFNATSILSPTTTNGDGNEALDNAAEWLRFWQHLEIAGLIQGNFDGVSDNIPGLGVLSGPITDQGYNARTDLFPTESTLQIGAYASTTPWSILSTQDMLKLDKKFDDGRANAGFLRARATTNSCCTVDTTCATSNNYDLSQGGRQCHFYALIANITQ